MIERHAVSNRSRCAGMVRHLLANPAGSFSVNKFYGDLHSQNIAVAEDILHADPGHLEDAFLNTNRVNVVRLRAAADGQSP